MEVKFFKQHLNESYASDEIARRTACCLCSHTIINTEAVNDLTQIILSDT
jgi:hypothetical protein